MMRKLCISWLILVPLVGCTVVAADDSGTPSTGPGSNAGAAGSSSEPTTNGPGSGGGAGTSGTDSRGCSFSGLPEVVDTLLSTKCASCHGRVPLPGLTSLINYATLTEGSKTQPGFSNAQASLNRLKDPSKPMPPVPEPRATESEIKALEDFIDQDYPRGCDGTNVPSGMGGGGPTLPAPVCSSMSTWTGGNRGSPSMNPGKPCIRCHKGIGPTYSLAGTVFPTVNEPDDCNSTVGADGARIVITDADGQVLTLTPNSVGNFYVTTAIKLPYRASVTYQGRERAMLATQTSGDCNLCHGQDTTATSPGRVAVP